MLKSGTGRRSRRTSMDGKIMVSETPLMDQYFGDYITLNTDKRGSEEGEEMQKLIDTQGEVHVLEALSTYVTKETLDDFLHFYHTGEYRE